MSLMFQPGMELVLATHNQGKLREISERLAACKFNLSCAADYGLDDPVEDAPDFAGNALIKARYVFEKTGKTSLSDDSGLCVQALNGAPGVLSARWAGDERDFNIAMKKVQDKLEAQQTADYTACFRCAWALILPDGREYIFEGRIDGQVSFPPRGPHGFGYDPIFVPAGYQQTFGQMPPERKQLISHRAQAFAKLMAFMIT